LSTIPNPWGMGAKPAGWDEYQARKATHAQRIAQACGAYQEAHPDELAELKADERRQAKREARRESGKLSEHEEQCLLVQALEAAGLLYMAIPNGVTFALKGRALFSYRAYLKAEGLTKGAPDLIVDGGGGRALLVEMKAIGGRLSPEQDALHRAWREAGYRVIVGFGWRDCWRQIQEARE